MTASGPSREVDVQTRGDTEVLEFGRAGTGRLARLFDPPALPHWPVIRGLGLTALLGVGLAVGLGTHGRTGHLLVPTKPHDVGRISVAAVQALANQPGRLRSYVRQASPPGGCAPVPIGRSPARSVATTVHAAFPGYAFEDAGETLDQFTGLCSLDVRASHGDAVLVVTVASPTAHERRFAYTRLETGIETDGAVTTKYAIAVNGAGWTVLIGATGSNAALPRAADLIRIAQEPSLTW
jgi:hypothetical protein